MLFDAWSVSQFVARLLDLRKTAPFTSVYLYWKDPDVKNSHKLTALVVELRKKLLSHSVNVGLVVEGAKNVLSAFHFPR